MICVILAGGRGTRLSEETLMKPKPLVEAGGFPLIWHIMKNYSRFGYTEFIILTGYKSNQIVHYFHNLKLQQPSITFDYSEGTLKTQMSNSINWKITIVDTGIDTPTAGRLFQIKDLLKGTFSLTYGDGISDVDISKLVSRHINSGKIATLTAVRPPARFGALEITGDSVTRFTEKPFGEGGWINGGFFILESSVFEYIKDITKNFESEALPDLAVANQLSAFKHDGFFIAVDTLRDVEKVNEFRDNYGFPWL